MFWVSVTIPIMRSPSWVFDQEEWEKEIHSMANEKRNRKLLHLIQIIRFWLFFYFYFMNGCQILVIYWTFWVFSLDISCKVCFWIAQIKAHSWFILSCCTFCLSNSHSVWQMLSATCIWKRMWKETCILIWLKWLIWVLIYLMLSCFTGANFTDA